MIRVKAGVDGNSDKNSCKGEGGRYPCVFLLQILNLLMSHGAQLHSHQTKEIMEVVIQHGEFRIVECLLELGVEPKLLTLEKGDTPLHAALTIALDKEKGQHVVFVVCCVYVVEGDKPLYVTRRKVSTLCLLCVVCMLRKVTHLCMLQGDNFTCCVCCVCRPVCLEKGDTPLHAARRQFHMLCLLCVSTCLSGER